MTDREVRVPVQPVPVDIPCGAYHHSVDWSTAYGGRVSIHPDKTPTVGPPQQMTVEAVQEMVCAILKSVFGRPEIDLDVHFLDLGGSSIEALRVVNMIECEMGTVVPIPLIFEAPTIRDLCASLAEITTAEI